MEMIRQAFLSNTARCLSSSPSDINTLTDRVRDGCKRQEHFYKFQGCQGGKVWEIWSLKSSDSMQSLAFRPCFGDKYDLGEIWEDGMDAGRKVSRRYGDRAGE